MENQHRKISGYRELSQKEIDLMNKIKELGPQIEAVLKEVKSHLHDLYIQEDRDEAEEERLIRAQPDKFITLSEDYLQTGLMYATRAVAQPTFF